MASLASCRRSSSERSRRCRMNDRPETGGHLVLTVLIGTEYTRLTSFVRYCGLMAFACAVDPAMAQDIPAPYSQYYGTVQRVIDGDTLQVRIDLWPGLQGVYAVRVRGIDAPELHGAACPQEKLWAQDAQALATRFYGPGTTVRMQDIELDSFGRAVADVRRWRSDRWLYFADEMVERGMAEMWMPNMPGIDWCALATAR